MQLKETALRKFFVPGRIELLGKHTDYAGGRSLLCAVERGFCVAVRPRSDASVRVIDAVTGTRNDSVYVSTVTARLARNFPTARRGADVAFASDLPVAAG